MKLLAVVSSVVLVLVLMLSCGGGTAVDEAPAGLPAGPHPMIVLAVDGLRADALGCYGGPAATPALDALAAESLRFEWAFAQAPEMLPSLGAALSGLYPTSNGLRAPGDLLQPAAETLAEALGGAGLRTVAFVEGPPGGADYGLAQGFDSYQVVQAPGAEAMAWLDGHAGEPFLLLVAGWGSRALEDAARLLGPDGAIPGERVAEVLASRGGDDELLFDADEMVRVRDWYAARVQVIDGFVGELVDRLRELGLDERATLVVMGSNGFALQEHGDLLGETVYAAATRVPLLVRLPGGQRAGTVSRIVELVDLMPTLLELAGAAPPAAIQGASLLPVADGTAPPPFIAFGEGPGRGGQRFVALAGYRAVATGPDAALELFHTEADPLELEDVAAAEPDKAAKLAADLEAWAKMIAAASLDPELRTDAELDDETLKQLKSLGYIQ
jgi:arylsulfatase A-like enzyme